VHIAEPETESQSSLSFSVRNSIIRIENAIRFAKYHQTTFLTQNAM
jgi:hypothetical protein